jgi:hypothetical protein
MSIIQSSLGRLGRTPALAIWICAVLALLAAPGPAEARIEGEAIVGQPWGVGRVTLSGPDVAIDANRVLIYEKNGRVHYPAVTTGVINRLIGTVLGDPTDRPATSINVYFLFRGEEPLELTVYTPQTVTATLTPRADEAGPRRPPILPRRNPDVAVRGAGAYDRLFAVWWREYNAATRQQREMGDHPPLVQNYLLTMLAQRTGQEPPLLERLRGEEAPARTTQSLELLAGMERLRMQTLRATMQGQGDFGQAADQPLPPEPIWAPLPLLPQQESPEIEPIALRVPHECFYIRFGKFSNYLWMTKLVEEYGGDLSSMITLRSYLAPMNKRVQDQLGLEQNLLAELLGDQVIADVALIGRDTFLKEGAAMGILFQAKSTEVLRNDLTSQRSRAFAKEKARGATSETVKIGGRDVSFVSTPDNRLRSFYVVDGDYHLVSTSRDVVERFLAVSKGAGSLGESSEFHFARSNMPLARKDTIFLYFSAAFFQNLLSPQYQVELERRMKSVTDMELLQLARLAAHGEQLPYESIEDLVAAGLLPRGFGRRPDGSGPVLTEDGCVDSRRGMRGWFLPIPDVKMTGITRAEWERIDQLNVEYAREWRRMDPLMIGIQRFALPEKEFGPNRERIVIDANVNPLDETKYGWLLSILGAPSKQMVTPAEGDIVLAQASVRGGTLFPSVQPHYLFLGMQDIAPLVAVQPTGLLQWYNLLRSAPAYVGATPRAGYLDVLPFNLGGSVPDENGFSRLPFGLWRRQGGGLSVVSFDPELLARVTPQLRVVDAEQEAQIRVHVGDLNGSKVEPWVNGMYYQRAITASAGNTRFVHQLNQQLHVPMAQAKELAEDLLDAKLHCSLGGEYQLLEEIGGPQVWESSAWAKRGDLSKVPEDFEAPILKWFHGLDMHLLKTGDEISVHAELDMERKPTEPKIDIPFLNLFGGGKGQKALAPKPQPPGSEELPPPLPPVKSPPKADPPLPGAREL